MAIDIPNIFHTDGVRGIWRVDFDAVFAQRLGAKVAAHLKTGTVVIGHDAEVSSREVAYALMDGAMHTGAQVIDIGEVSGPQLSWAIGHLQASGGIMVASTTADTRVCVVEGSGYVIGGDYLRQLHDSQDHIHRSQGTIVQQDIIPGYAVAVAAAAEWSGGVIHMSVDAPTSVRRALECIAPIAPGHGLAARFDTGGVHVTFYDHGQPISSQVSSPLPEAILMRFIKRHQ